MDCGQDRDLAVRELYVHSRHTFFTTRPRSSGPLKPHAEAVLVRGPGFVGRCRRSGEPRIDHATVANRDRGGCHLTSRVVGDERATHDLFEPIY